MAEATAKPRKPRAKKAPVQVVPKTPREQFIALLLSTEKDGIQDLINYLETSDFFTAPASTRFHGAHEGGLVEHCLAVLDCMIFLYESYKKNKYPVPEVSKSSMIITCLLHDLCKCNCYHVDYRNAKNEAGVWEKVPYYRRQPLIPMGHGGKSVFLIQNFIDLSVEEAVAIFWHMGAYDTSGYMTLNELGQAYTDTLLAFMLHQADMMSTYIVENENYN